jgi:hypothetical protein
MPVFDDIVSNAVKRSLAANVGEEIVAFCSVPAGLALVSVTGAERIDVPFFFKSTVTDAADPGTVTFGWNPVSVPGLLAIHSSYSPVTGASPAFSPNEVSVENANCNCDARIGFMTPMSCPSIGTVANVTLPMFALPMLLQLSLGPLMGSVPSRYWIARHSSFPLIPSTPRRWQQRKPLEVLADVRSPWTFPRLRAVPSYLQGNAIRIDWLYRPIE